MNQGQTPYPFSLPSRRLGVGQVGERQINESHKEKESLPSVKGSTVVKGALHERLLTGRILKQIHFGRHKCLKLVLLMISLLGLITMMSYYRFKESYNQRKEWESWKAEIQPFISPLVLEKGVLDFISIASDPLPPELPSIPWNSLEEFMRQEENDLDDIMYPPLNPASHVADSIECRPTVWLKTRPPAESEIDKMIQCVGKVFEACCHHPYFREFNVGNYPTNKDPPRFCNVSNTLQLELLRYPKLVWTLSDNSTIGCQCPQVEDPCL